MGITTLGGPADSSKKFEWDDHDPQMDIEPGVSGWSFWESLDAACKSGDCLKFVPLDLSTHSRVRIVCTSHITGRCCGGGIGPGHQLLQAAACMQLHHPAESYVCGEWHVSTYGTWLRMSSCLRLPIPQKGSACKLHARMTSLMHRLAVMQAAAVIDLARLATSPLNHTTTKDQHISRCLITIHDTFTFMYGTRHATCTPTPRRRATPTHGATSPPRLSGRGRAPWWPPSLVRWDAAAGALGSCKHTHMLYLRRGDTLPKPEHAM